MKTTFLNTSKENRTNLRKLGRQHLKSRAADFTDYMRYGTDIENLSDDGNSKAITFFEETGSFFDYGLALDYVPGTFKNKGAGYFRYQLSYGGPSEEIRFYFTPGAKQAYKIEFVYLDWGVGVGFDATNEDWAIWLFDWFNEVGTIEAEMKKAL